MQKDVDTSSLGIVRRRGKRNSKKSFKKKGAWKDETVKETLGVFLEVKPVGRTLQLMRCYNPREKISNRKKGSKGREGGEFHGL